MTDHLLEHLRDARRRTLALVADLSDADLTVSKLEIVNPFLWELGHVAFFHDAFILGYLDGADPLLDGAPRIYDSFKVDHDDRWDLPLPDRGATLSYMARVAEAVEARLVARGSGEGDYCYWLSMLHEDMHGEAFVQTRQALGYPVPSMLSPVEDASGAWPGDVRVPGGRFMLGASRDTENFVFDNEKWAHEVEIPEFHIARAPVTNAEFVEFVESGGYDREELWTPEGWVWRCKFGVRAPEYWRNADGGWTRREFDVDVELAPHQPVRHVGYHDSQAYCAWAGRRLPTEAEWEMAASYESATGSKRRYPWGECAATPAHANLDGRLRGCVDVAAHPEGDSPVGCRQMLGNVWEWTDCAFYPFPGYVVDLPYREYSAPWFGYRKVLKGGAFPTRARLVNNCYRNFFTPDRRDIAAGFRTCAR
jgi:ergothioneine biosynthesis protein EgtB